MRCDDQLLLNHLPCRAFVSTDKILGMDGVGQILVAFDLNPSLPGRLMQAYRKKEDSTGEHCLSNMTTQLGLTADAFGHKVNRMLNEYKMTLYLTD